MGVDKNREELFSGLFQASAVVPEDVFENVLVKLGGDASCSVKKLFVSSHVSVIKRASRSSMIYGSGNGHSIKQN